MGASKGKVCGRKLKEGKCSNHPTGTKKSFCSFLLVRGARAGQPCSRMLYNDRCRNHPAEEAPAETTEPVVAPTSITEADLSMEASADAVVAALAAVEAAVGADKLLLIVVLRKAIHIRARAVAHDGLATKPRALLEHHACLAMKAAGQIALAELDVEGQTLTAERRDKQGQYMQSEMQYWSPLIFAK